MDDQLQGDSSRYNARCFDAQYRARQPRVLADRASSAVPRIAAERDQL
jgi:hypothetical protein